jgi:hypothetical protein
MRSELPNRRWIVIGILEGSYVTPDRRRFENVQVIARVSTLPDESVWEALVREAESNSYIKELLAYGENGRWESIIAYELTGVRLEPESHDVTRLELIPA